MKKIWINIAKFGRVMMRIEKIILKNFRQYKNLELSFPLESSNDLHIIIGQNGMGKTTLLNSINWCLYDEEPHSSESSSKLPLLNLESIENSEDDLQEVSVELWVKTNDMQYILFQRSQLFRIIPTDNIPIPGNSELTVTIQNQQGNTKIIEDEKEALKKVNRFVPKEIREFYFFDGERLDNYFKDTKGKNIKNQVQILSSILYLVNMESRLEKMQKSLTQDAGKLNPDIESKREELKIAEKRCESLKEEIIRINDQIEKSEIEIKGINNKLIDLPDATELEQKRKRFLDNKKELEEILIGKKEEKITFLLKTAKIIFLSPTITKSLQIINKKKRNKEIPPTIDKSLLEKILFDCNCDVCGRPLDEKAKNSVEELLRTVKLSSEVVQELHSMENPLLNYKDDFFNFKEKRNEKQKEIQLYEKQIDNSLNEIKEIDEKLLGHDVKQIKEWVRQRKLLEEANKTNLVKKGTFNEQLKIKEKKSKIIGNDLKKLVAQENKARSIKKKLAFTDKALKVVKKTKKSIMIETKKFIESETKSVFFGLLWKTATFKDVKIDNNYNLKLIHKKGYDCLGSVSAAERELLALSFTLALHSISGFESPILIDTPVARVSDKHRENFADIFLKVSKDKQIILLLTPAEYSNDISKILNNNNSSKYEINLISDESEAKIEEIT